MRTYIKLWLSSQGSKPQEVIKKLETIHFKPIIGAYDLYYEWGDTQPTTDQVTELMNKIWEVLKGEQCLFKVDTKDIEYEKILFW